MRRSNSDFVQALWELPSHIAAEFEALASLSLSLSLHLVH
jgi:hypothetical protein